MIYHKFSKASVYLECSKCGDVIGPFDNKDINQNQLLELAKNHVYNTHPLGPKGVKLTKTVHSEVWIE